MRRVGTRFAVAAALVCAVACQQARPPQVADWRLAATPRPEATTLELEVNESECASGRDAKGRIEKPDVSYGADRITLIIRVRPLAGNSECQSNPWTPYTVQLSEPVGNRVVTHAASATTP